MSAVSINSQYLPRMSCQDKNMICDSSMINITEQFLILRFSPYFVSSCLAVKCFVGTANYSNNLWLRVWSQGGGGAAEESWGSGRCWGLLPSTMLPLLLSCANSWPRILAFLLLAPLTFIIALQHFPWTIMKVAILDKMLIFLPRSARLWPGCPVPGGGEAGVTQCCSRKTEKFIALWPGKSKIFVSTHFTFTGHLRFLQPPTSIQPRSYLLLLRDSLPSMRVILILITQSQ